MGGRNPVARTDSALQETGPTKMKNKIFSIAFQAAFLALCPAAFGQQVINGAVPTALSPTGVTQGVSMTGQGGGGTLNVGTPGGAQTDIFTNNSTGGVVTNKLLQAVSTDTSSQSNIVFNSSSNVYGAIGITNPGGPFFLNISGGNTGTVVNFNGGLYGTITTVSGTGALNFNNGATNITATNFAANGTINLASNTTLIGAMTTAAANSGTLVLGGGSVVTGAVGGATGLKAINVVGGSNAAGVSASISGSVDTFALNLGTNRLNIGGALTIANLAPSGVINTTLASATVYGNIQSTGAVNLGPALTVNVAVPQTAFFPVGTQFTIVKAPSGTNGSVVTIVNDPTNPLYTFSAVPAAGTVAGQVIITITGIPLTVPVAPPAGVALPPTQAIAAPLVPSLLAAAAAAAPGSDLLVNVLPAINAISNATIVTNALAQLAPSTSALGAPQVAFEGARAFQSLLSSHLNQGLCGQAGEASDRRQPAQLRDSEDPRRPNPESAACPEANDYDGLWGKAFGYFGNQSAQGAFLGYDSQIVGVMMGFDVPLNKDTRAGMGVGYAQSTLDGKTFSNSTSFNTYQAMAYIAHEDGSWFADGNLTYGWNDYSGVRHIVFPGINRTASATYGGVEFTGLVTGGRHFSADDYTITPLFSLQATHVGLNAYTETGAGDINLRVAAQNYTFLESGLGANVARNFDLEDGRGLLSELHAKWLRQLLGQKLQNTARFTATGSTTFDIPGQKQEADTLNVGGGVTLLSCACGERTWSVNAGYDFYWRSGGYSANQVTLAVADRF